MNKPKHYVLIIIFEPSDLRNNLFSLIKCVLSVKSQLFRIVF